MLDVNDLSVAYDGQPVLRDVDLTVRRGEILCLLGASGSGKTTLLRVIAGLEPVYGGTVQLEDQRIDGVPVHQRGFGLMFQDFALFPHMDVLHNVMFGLKMRGVTNGEKRQRAAAVLDLVGLAGFDERDVTVLSGGEKQRVALARSLAPRPRLLMLDEPLGSLDATLKERLVVDLRRIIKEVGLTAVYVTHDQEEAFAVADRIAVMRDGEIAQVDTPQSLYHNPRTTFIARFLRLNNIVPVKSHENGEAATPIGRFPLEHHADSLLIHPADIALGAGDDDAFTVEGVVQECVFQGSSYRLRVQCGPETVLSFEVGVGGPPAPDLDQRVQLHFDADALVPLEDDGR